jgi:hypothetical protein
VAVDVFITADVEYTGVQLPIDFDERYLRLASAEQRFLSGRAIINNNDLREGADPREGNLLVLSATQVGKRRIAAAGEEYHAARLFFDVLERAAETHSTAVDVRRIWTNGAKEFDPVIIVRHLHGEAAQPIPAEGEIAPITIVQGAFAIIGEAGTPLGDVNLDGDFNIADPVSLLGFLFLGDSEPLCFESSDYNRDGRLSISDPIGMLSTLFQGGGSTTDRGQERVDCR